MATSKKSITPIIAIILTMMMVVAVAGAMFYWLTRIQEQGQGGVESFNTRFFSTAATAANVIRTNYNGTFASNEFMSVLIQNTGNAKVATQVNATPSVEWVVSDSAGRTVCTQPWNGAVGSNRNVICSLGCGADINPGQIRELRLNITSTECTLVNITNGTQINFIITFQGKATAAGSFVKEASS